MSNPFPGMNPYLEGHTLWPSIHHYLITQAVVLLQPALNPLGYFATAEERIWLIEPRQSYYPDLSVRELRQTQERRQPVAPTAIADPPVRHARRLLEHKESFIEIHWAESDELVCVIEILSPTNKLTIDGRRLFQRKQRSLRSAGLHLVEIDLLREGRRLSRIDRCALRKVGRFDYLINIDRLDSLEFEFYPVRLPNRLPRIPVPLRRGDPDAILDLQAALETAYDIGAFDMRIDYTLPPIPALAEDDAHWADELLKSKGLR